MDTSHILANFIVETQYEMLPENAVDITKKDILDVLGTMFAGSEADGIRQLGMLTKEWGGKEESAVVAYDCKVPAPSAALVNGAMGHALDFDDGHDAAVVHAATTVVPAAFSVAQRVQGIDGRSFIAAVALGMELDCRMGKACKKMLRDTGWVHTAIFGYFAAAAGAGKILNLSVEQMINAIGIAHSQSAGSFQSIEDAVLTKRLQPGFASRAGVLAALLAEKGVTGIQNSMDGQWGIYNIYHRGAYDKDILVADLGKRYEMADIGFKAFPSCGYTHAPISATLKLVKENGIKPEDVDEIIVSTGNNAGDLMRPLDRKRKPESIPDSQFSIPYTVATALVKGKVGIGDFTLEEIKNPEILKISMKVKPNILEELTKREIEPAIVEIRTTDGKAYSERVERRKGHPDNPMSMDELIDKFRDCVQHGKKKISEESVSEVIRMVQNLEEVENVSKIMELLT